MSALQPVRGTRDLLPDDSRRHRHVVETARAIAERYGYLEIAVPILEPTESTRLDATAEHCARLHMGAGLAAEAVSPDDCP